MKKNGEEKEEERTKKKKEMDKYELRIFLYLLYLLSFSSSNSTHVLSEGFSHKMKNAKEGQEGEVEKWRKTNATVVNLLV